MQMPGGWSRNAGLHRYDFLRCFRLLNSEIGNDHLRYIHVLHVGFDNQVHEGELVVNRDIADDVLEIFKELYERQ